MTNMKNHLIKLVFATAFLLSMVAENSYGQLVDADVTPSSDSM